MWLHISIAKQNILFFLGGTIGNKNPWDIQSFLNVRKLLRYILGKCVWKHAFWHPIINISQYQRTCYGRKGRKIPLLMGNAVTLQYMSSGISQSLRRDILTWHSLLWITFLKSFKQFIYRKFATLSRIEMVTDLLAHFSKLFFSYLVRFQNQIVGLLWQLQSSANQQQTFCPLSIRLVTVCADNSI
jgi:hypothetical protein